MTLLQVVAVAKVSQIIAHPFLTASGESDHKSISRLSIVSSPDEYPTKKMATADPPLDSEPPLPQPPSAAAAAASPPASPPLPSKPVLAVPGPRASRLQEVFEDRLRHTLAKLSYPNVAACYPTIAAKSPAILRSIQGQMVSVMELKAKTYFERILEDRDVVRKLNELEGLVAAAGQRRAEGEMDGRAAPTP